MTLLLTALASLVLSAVAGWAVWRRHSHTTATSVPARYGAGAARQLALAAVAVAVIVCAYVAALSSSPRAIARNVDLGSGASMIVIDLSGSIDQFEMTMIGKTLQALARNPDRRVGLVFFSDSGVEVLPPQTPAGELEKISRFFKPDKVRTPTTMPPGTIDPMKADEYHIGSASVSFTLPTQPNPWQAAFNGGTSITRGLINARQALERVGAARHGQIIVISDLQDNANAEQHTELLREIRDGIDVKVVFVGLDPDYKKMWSNLFGPNVFVPNPSILAQHRPDSLTKVHTSPASWIAAALLIVAAAALLLFRLTPTLRSDQ